MNGLLRRGMQRVFLVCERIFQSVMPGGFFDLCRHHAEGRLSGQFLRGFRFGLRRVQPHLRTAQGQLVQGGGVHLPQAQRGKDRGVITHAAPGRSHPTLPDFRRRKRTVSGRQRHRSLATGQGHGDAFIIKAGDGHGIATLKPCAWRFAQHSQSVPFRHRDLRGTKQRPAAVERRQPDHLTFTLHIAQRQAIITGGNAVNHKPFMTSRLSIPTLHHHPIAVVVAHLLMATVQPHRLQRGDGVLFLAQHALCAQGITHRTGECRLFADTGNLCHAVFSLPYTACKVGGQPVITLTPVRLADDVHPGFLPLLPAQRIHARFFHHCQGAAGAAALPAVGHQ